MDKQIVRTAVVGIEAILSKAKSALNDLTSMTFGRSDESGGHYENPRDAMAWHFEQLYDHLLIVLEAAGLPEARAELISRWMKLKKLDGGLGHTDQFGEFDHLTSPVFEYLEHLVSALRMTFSNEITSENGWDLNRLEEMLRDTDSLVHRRGVIVSNEMDVQKVMHDYLRASFRGFVHNPQIGGAIKSFKPDCGIRHLRVAIEFKIAHTKEEAVKAFSGVVEDTAGYRGSKDWTLFYAVFYQAKPFLPRADVESDLKRIGAASWKAILVNGETTPKKRKKSQVKSAAPRQAPIAKR